MRILVDEFPFSPEHCVFMKRSQNGKYICSIGKRLYKCEAECDLMDRNFENQCLGLKLLSAELKETEVKEDVLSEIELKEELEE